MGWSPFLTAGECLHRIETCTIVVAHAGMGTILTALELGKPVIVMPRRADLREHRNDHQLATARKLLALGRLAVAFDEEQLRVNLERLVVKPAGERISKHASPQLLGALRRFAVGETATAVSCRPRLAANLRDDDGDCPAAMLIESDEIAVTVGTE
jgi:hypothetical protein